MIVATEGACLATYSLVLVSTIMARRLSERRVAGSCTLSSPAV